MPPHAHSAPWSDLWISMSHVVQPRDGGGEVFDVTAHIVQLGDQCHQCAQVPWGAVLDLFGWVVCDTWCPHECQNPECPSRILHCGKLLIIQAIIMVPLCCIDTYALCFTAKNRI